MPVACPARRDLEQQRRLSHTGLSGEEHHNPRHQAVAEHPVQLGDAGAGMCCQPGVDGANWHCLTDRDR